MMAKAVANSTSATFIQVVGSEFAQKYLGEGPRMVNSAEQLFFLGGEVSSTLFQMCNQHIL
jgi:ATP-dependent 26S proteasome regulatory subunit